MQKEKLLGRLLTNEEIEQIRVNLEMEELKESRQRENESFRTFNPESEV